MYDIDEEYDFLILACDGVWDVIDNDKAVKIIKEVFDKKGTPEEAADALSMASIGKGSTDDITAIVIKF